MGKTRRPINTGKRNRLAGMLILSHNVIYIKYWNEDVMSKLFWRSLFMFWVAKKVSKLDGWLWDKMAVRYD